MAPDRTYSNEEIKNEIRKLADELGKSPTWDEFQEKAKMASKTAVQRFGGWNEAKEEAGVETYVYTTGGNKDPNSKVGIYRNAKSSGCRNCDEDFSSALTFHHLPEYEKSFNISKYRAVTPTKDELRDEINKCVVLCANCHRKVHANEHPLTVDKIR